MATLRAVGGTDSLPLSRSWKDYFMCCFMRTSPSSSGGAGWRGTSSARGAPSHGLPSSAAGSIVDYGSRDKSEYAPVVTSRSAAEDGDASDASGKQPRTATAVELHNGGEEKRKKFSSTPAESMETPKNQPIAPSTEAKPTATPADGNNCSNNNRPGPPQGATILQWAYGNDRRNMALGRNGEGRIEEEQDLDEESQPSGPVSAPEDGVAGAVVAAGAWAVNPAGLSSEHDTLDVGESTSHLFDISDLQLDKSSSTVGSSRCGSIRLTLAYNDTRELMTVTVHEAHDIPRQGQGGASQTQVRMLLLPAGKTRQRTKVKPGDNPQFEEVLEFKVPRGDVSSMALRVRLYGCERFRRECLIGETMLAFASFDALDSSSPQTTSINLEPRNSLSHYDSMSDVSSLAASESSSSTVSLQHLGTPELMLGLAYNATIGRLSVEVIKGSNFRSIGTKRRPDTYVKMTLTAPNGQEITSSKTSVRRSEANPLFKEMFVFQVAQFQLTDVSLLVSIFAQRSLKRKDTIGWFSLGHKSSSEEEQGHWNAMLGSKGEPVCRWHALNDP